jgi:hypothetical protein
MAYFWGVISDCLVGLGGAQSANKIIFSLQLMKGKRNGGVLGLVIVN